MNRVYKVIYNRARNLYQVVSEIVHSRGKTKSLTAQHRHDRLTTSILIALFAMGTSLPVGWAANTTVADAKVDASNIGANLQLADGTTAATDEEKKKNEEAWGNAIGLGAVASGDSRLVSGKTMYTELRSGITSTNTIAAGKTVAQNLNALDQAIGKIAADGTYNYIAASNPVSTNLTTLDTQVKTNADAISTETTARTNADTALSDRIGTLDANATTTAARLTTLDNTLKTFADQLGVDLSNNTNLANQLYKYFKVNPKVTTTNTTTTYDHDAAANGTNSVAIGPSAQAGEKTKDATTSATTVTGGTSSTAIGDSAKANGDQSVALGYNSQVLNTSGSTTAVSGSTAIGNGAKVEGGSDSTALGTNAAVDTASNAMALGTSATINKTATSGVAIGNGAVTGSADTTKTVNNVTYNIKAAGGEDSVAIGTSASSAGNTSIALGKGAAIENDTDGNYQAVVKSDDVAIGTGAKTSASDSSTAIGKEAKVSQSTDALAVGSGAQVSTSNNAMAFGKGANAGSAADSIAMGTRAKTISADTIAIGQSTSAEGANSVVIGKNAKTTTEGGNAIGTRSAASGSSTAIGQSAMANNYNAVAIGNNATANADKSISLGYKAGVGTSEGKGEQQNAGSLIAIGTSSGNNVSGMQNVAIGEGAGSNVKSSYNIAIGTQAGYGINYASDDKTQNGFNVSVGYKANYQENSANIMYSTALGNEANASNYSVAVGNRAKAGGAHTVAIGEDAQAADASSVALGQNASAADGNIAIGNGSSAPAVSTLGTVKAVTVDGTTVYYVYDANGNQFKSAFTYKPLQADSHYVSVGSGTLTRRISNVADGVFDSDAATVGQLNSLNELLQATDTKVGLNKEYFEEKFTNLNTTIDASKTHYFSISESSDNLSANKDNKGAISNKADAMAIGPNANATNVKSLAVGNNVYANGLRSIAIGTAPNPTKDSAGTTTTHNTSADGENSIALGTSTTAQAANSIAIGTRAQTYTTDTTSNTGVSSVAIGNLATTAGNQSVALGYNATVKYNYGTAIGAEALASGNDAVAIGKGSKAYSTDSTAIGQDNSITGNNVYGLGSSNEMNGKWGAITQSGVSGYKNIITSVSDQDTTNALTGIYMTGNSNTFNQNVKYNVMQDITVQGSSNTIDGGAGGTSSHQNTLSQIAIVGSGNTVQGKSSDDGKTNNIKDVTILGYNNTVDANKDTTVDFSNTQILGNNVTAALGNSVYLGNNAAYVQPNGPAQKAIDAAKTKADTAAEASDEYKAAATDEDKATIKAQYEAKYLYKLRVQAMEAKGTTAGMNSYNTDETYGNGTSYTYGNGTNYTYAGSNPTGVITVGSVGSERRIQNVAAGLVSATSTDAVNGSQLYALTRQIRFGGDNSSFGDTAAGDTNVVARGSNEKISITGGSDAVTSSTTDGKTTYTVDAAKLTGNNIAVVANTGTNALHVQLASNLKDLNTAQLGKTTATTTTATDGTESTTYSYQETLKLDGTGDNGGTLALEDASGKNGVTLRTSGSTTTADVNGTATTRLFVNGKTVATTDDGLKFGGDTGTDSALKLNNKLNVKGGADTTKLTDNNIGVVSDGKDTLTVKLNKNVNLGTDGSLTTGTVSATTVTTGSSTLDTNGLTITGGPKFTSNGINANNQQIKGVTAGTDDTDAANYSQIKKATTTLTTGKNGNVNVTTNTTPTADGHTNYIIAVDNLKLQATTGDTSVALADGINFKNGTNTTSAVDASGNVTIDTKNLTLKANGGTPATVTMDGGINFKDGKNTTASVGTDGTVTISATHNKLDSASYTASRPSDTSNQTTVKLKDTDNNETTLNLTDTYTTVSKNTDHTITFKRNDGSNPVSISLDDLNGASKEALTTAAAKATTAVIKGSNVDSVEDDTTSADGHHIYKVNVSNLGVKVADGQKKSVALSDGLVFGNGTNTTASVGNNGAITFNVSNDAIKTQAKDAINVVKGNNNVTVDTTTSTDGLSKTFTISATHNTLKSATLTKGANDVSTLTITGNDGDTASVDIKNTYLTVSKDTANKTVTFTRNDGITPATTLSLSDFGAASTTDMTAAVAKATTEVRAGANASLGTVETDTTDQHKIYTVNVDNLGVSQNGTKVGTGVSLKDGLNFTDGTNTTASVAENGTVSYSVSNDAIKAQAKDAVVVAAGDNVSIDAPTDANNVKTYTVKVNDLKLQANGEDKGTRKLAEGINFANGKNTTATVENGKVVYSLNDDLTDLTSVTAKDTAGNQTLVSGSGVTITPAAAGAKPISLTTNGLSIGNQQITNVQSGGDTDTNAANISDVKRLVQASANGTTETGFNVKGDDATAKKVKLGKQLNVVGGTTDSTQLSTGNIGVETTADAEGNATLTVKLKKDIALDSVTTGSTTMNTIGISNGDMSLTNTGMIIKNNDVSKQVSITTSGVSMGSQQVKNVADGTDTKDAVNKGQLDVVQTQVTNGWQIVGSNGQKVADIGAGKKVTFGDTTYATASVQPDGTESAKVTYTIKTAGLTADTATGKITEPTTDGVATAQNVAQAINSAAWNIKANDGATTAIKAGTTVGLKAGNNLTLSQSDTDFTYTLNDTLTGIKSLATVAQDGVTTTLTAGGVTIASSGTGNKSVSLTANGLNNGGKQITDVASGGDTDTNAANISDVKRLVQASANGTTETGFNVKGDDATAKKVKLGKQLSVVGGTNDASKLSDNNIGVVTTANDEGNATLTVKLNKDINLDSVKTGNTTLNTNGVSNGDMSLTNTGLVIKNNDPSKQVSVTTSGVSMGSQRIQNVADATQDTDAATLKQVKNARTVVAKGDNVKEVTSSEATDGSHQMTYTVNVDNLSVKANNEAAKSVTLKNGLTFNNGTNTAAFVGDNGEVKYDLNSTLTGLTSVTAGNSTLDTNGLTIKEGTATKVAITSGNVTMGGNVIHNVGDGVAPTDAVNKGQLDDLQKQVTGGWNLAGKNAEGTAVTAQIGAGKTVTYDNGNYTKSVATKDDSNNATVKVDVTTGAFGSGTDDKAGTVTATVNGLATTQDVANAINSATINVVADNTPDNKTAVKAGDTIHFAKDDNLILTQNGTKFTYGLSKDINISKVTTSDATKGSTVQTAEGITTTDAAGNTYIQNGQGITLTPSDETKSPVKLTNSGLNNGGNKITNVADGEVKAHSQEAVNGSQLYALQQKVTNGGWDIIGENENRSTHIGNDKTVSFKNGRNSTVSVTGTDTGAEVKVDVNTAQISTDGSTHTATVTGTGLADATEVVNAINSAAWNVQKQGGTVQQVKAGDTVTFDASNNIVLTQNGTSFTYGLAPDVNTKSIRLGGSQDTSGSWTGGIFIGNQIGGGANHNEGNYITGLDNTSWDLSKVVDNRAATEAQLKAAINQITLKEQNGGFALKDESGNEKGKVSQTLGNAIAIVGDTEYESDGKTVKKAGNITTEADGTNVGGIKVKLNKNLDLSDEGSLRVGSSKVSNGAIQLGEDASANKILMDSTNGTASIGGVNVNGAEKTVNGLSNTKWTGKAVDGQAATENQLVEAINEAKTQAANSELHIKKGVYAIGKDSNGQDITDKTSKNSVSIDVVNAKGAVDGQVVINDVAKASELGTVGELADNLKNPAGGSTTVVQAVNKVNQKVDDSLKQVNGDVTNAVTEAKKHTEVQSVDSDNNVTIDGKTTNAAGGKVYKLGLNKQHMNLDKVHIYGTEGKVTAKDVEAETVKTGNTTVADGRVVVGGDNGIKIEANDGQQTILGLSNRTWNGRAVSGRAATEDQLQQAVENATATAAQNEQHIQAGNYNVGLGKGLDGKAIDKNSVAINVVSGDGTKPGDVKGQVVINNVAKADELGDVAKLNDTVKNADGRPTSTVDAINNLDKRVETTVGDNVYSGVKGKEIADGDSATTAIGKLNNRMNDIYTTAGQHSSVSTADTNLTLSESKNTSGGTDYKIGLNKDQINLGNLTIKGNEGSIEANSIKSDSFTAGDTVVNKDGIKVGDQSALTGDSLKVNGKTYVDDKGVNANGQVIRNVGDGKDDGDAVNVKQVNDLAARQGEVIGQNAAHINQLDRAVNRLDSRINRVGAGAAALAALHPGNYDPDDKVDFAAGFGNYRGASAAAVGMYYHPDETTTMSVGASFGGGENMVNAGITWKMGKDSGHMRTQAATKAVPVQFVAAPTQTTQPTGQTEGTKTPQPVTAVTTTASGQQVPIVAAYLPSVDNSTRAENDELKELLARQTAILEKLAEQKTAAAPAAAAAPVSGEDLFPDVPENHWAYDFVAKLAKAGALKDCRVGAPANNPMLTRNDFAQILYTALKNGATKNPALNKDNGLNRLASEFRVELKNVKR